MTRHFSPAAKSPCSDAAAPVSPVSGAAATSIGTEFAGLPSKQHGKGQTGEADVPNLSTVCTDCEGTGFFVIGEFHPDDPRASATYDCDNCEGTGEVDEPTYEDWAAPFRRLRERFVEVERLGPGRIAV